MDDAKEKFRREVEKARQDKTFGGRTNAKKWMRQSAKKWTTTILNAAQ